MPGKVFVIHPSLVIQKGFQAILRTFCKREIVLSSRVQKLNNDGNFAANDIVLVDAIHAFEIKTNRKLIIEVEELVAMDDHQISIYSSSDLLKAKIDYFDAQLLEPAKSTQDPNALTEREEDVLKLIAYGHTNKDIAEKLFISVHTVISHRKNITEKLSIKSISGLTVYAMLNNLIDSDSLDSSQLI